MKAIITKKEKKTVVKEQTSIMFVEFETNNN
jgi:hypothetical protein